MAYAEKPFRDDAHQIGKMIARSEVAAQTENNSILEDPLEEDMPHEGHVYDLKGVQERTVGRANEASDNLRLARIRADVERQHAEVAAQEEADRLSRAG